MEEFEKSLRRPFFYDMVMDNLDIYFSMTQYNALCKANLENDQIEVINTFPNISAYTWREYTGICKSKKWLLLSPSDKESDLLLYDILSAKFSRIINSEKISFYSFQAFEYEGNFYIVSVDTANIIKIELNGLFMKTFNNHENIMENAMIGIPIRIENRIYIPVNKRKVLLEFDLETKEYKSISFPDNISQIFTMSYSDSYFFITGSDRGIYAWNIFESEVEKIASIPNYVKSFYSGKVCFSHSIKCNNMLFLFPGFADTILKINLLTGNSENVEIRGEEELPEQINIELEKGRCFPAKYNIVEIKDEKIFFRSSKTRLLYELNVRTNSIVKHDLRIKNIYQNQIYPPAIKGIFIEKYYTNGISILIESLDKENLNIIDSQKQNIGALIHNKAVMK